jgi:hypothetical protein
MDSNDHFATKFHEIRLLSITFGVLVNNYVENQALTRKSTLIAEKKNNRDIQFKILRHFYSYCMRSKAFIRCQHLSSIFYIKLRFVKFQKALIKFRNITNKIININTKVINSLYHKKLQALFLHWMKKTWRKMYLRSTFLQKNYKTLIHCLDRLSIIAVSSKLQRSRYVCAFKANRISCVKSGFGLLFISSIYCNNILFLYLFF